MGRGLKGVLVAGVALLAAAGAVNTPAFATESVELPRAGWLGVSLENTPQGARVRSVSDAGSAARMGVATGDVIVSVGGTATADNAAVVAALRGLAAGAPVRVEVLRDGNRRTLQGAMVARPQESFEGATIRMGAVAFNGGVVRDILTLPERPAAGNPVIYFIQGVTCGTIESSGPDHPYAGFVQSMIERGIGVYRIEKPGIGDSRGGAACASIDYATELELFAKGYDALVQARGIDPSRIIVFGHSMGGFQAPALFGGTGRQVRGIAVMGTGMSPWQDYLLDVFRWQPVMQGAARPSQTEEMAARLRPVVDGLINNPGGPEAVAAQDPAYRELLRDALGWTSGDTWMGRTSAYWRGIGAQRTAAAWEKVTVPVLVLHGGKDLAVVDNRDAERIAHLVNLIEPGRGTYVELPDTNHDFTIINGRFDPVLAQSTADWIDRVMADDGSPLGMHVIPN